MVPPQVSHPDAMHFFPTLHLQGQLPARHTLLVALTTLSLSFQGSRPVVAAEGSIPGYVVRPLTLTGQGNQATLRVSVNGQKTMLILDTGAPVTALDTSFFKGTVPKTGGANQDQLPAELRRPVNANGQRAEIGMVNSLQAGPLDFGKHPVVLTDLRTNFAQYNNRFSNAQISGLIGQDILQEYGAVIDWRRRGVYFNTDKTKRMKLGGGLAAAGWTAVPMSSTEGRHYTVACTVEGQPVRLIVDTGSDFTTFTPGVVKFSHMMYNHDTGRSMSHLQSNALTMSMINGNAVGYPAKVERWKIGNYEIASSVVLVSPVPEGLTKEHSAGDGPILGLLGAEVLASNSAIIDVAGSMLYLKPTKR